MKVAGPVDNPIVRAHTRVYRRSNRRQYFRFVVCFLSERLIDTAGGNARACEPTTKGSQCSKAHNMAEGADGPCAYILHTAPVIISTYGELIR